MGKWEAKVDRIEEVPALAPLALVGFRTSSGAGSSGGVASLELRAIDTSGVSAWSNNGAAASNGSNAEDSSDKC